MVRNPIAMATTRSTPPQAASRSRRHARNTPQRPPWRSGWQLGLTCAAWLACLPLAQAACQGNAPDSGYSHAPSTLNVRLDNDILGGTGQDQGYSNGLKITWVSPNIADYANDPCLPAPARAINRYLNWLQAGEFEQQNMVISFGQALFTPHDKDRTDLITTDRPYAAILALGIGYQARSHNTLRVSHLALGVVGPAALGKPIQNGVHKMLGSERFRGWDNQLHNEPIVQLMHERLYRIAGQPSRSGWGWDAIGHAGGALGNLAIHANIGGELRYGFRLPDDFGSSPLRPAGDNSAPPGAHSANDGWAGHAFVSIDARAVARDLTLDGNTFRSSHKVDKRHFVGEVGYGLSFTRGAWKVTLARYHRSREFNGQPKRPVFGSMTIGYQF